MLDVFFKDKSQYNNQLNPVKSYIEQLTKYISVKKQISLEEAKEKAIKILKTHFKDKPIKYFERKENGDRVVENGTLLEYIKSNIAKQNILVPTFTSYINGKIKKSILSEFILMNVEARKIAKKAAQKAKAEGNIDLYIVKNNEQNTKKIANNSLSGVFSQQACILYNPTAHNTLTSITRTITSLSNASNEKLIAGNRYYPREIDILNNIVYITTYANTADIKKVVEKYNLYLPTVEDTVKVLRYSSDLYLPDSRRFYETKIIPYLQNLSPYELAGICYIGDLYQLRNFNDTFIRKLINDLITPVDTGGVKLSDIKEIYKIDEALLYFVHQIFFSKIKGFGKDYDKMNEVGLASNILATANKVKETLLKYKDFFNVFFMSGILPSNSFRLKNMRRRTVVLSDTDSTCFTLDEWVKWYRGEFFIDDKSIALAGCISYIASQTIVNSLAILSKNMNIEQDLLNTLAMKNEFLWTVHVPAEVSKHYFAQTVMCEGNVYKEPDIEIKGVHLKNSAIPKNITEDAKDIIKYILSTVAENKKIKLNDIIKRVITLEQEIANSIIRGESKYLKKSKIKNKEAYSQDETKSPYQQHKFWVDVFSPKYGDIQDPPYDVVKIPTTVITNTNLKTWLDSIKDTDLRKRLENWLLQHNKKNLPTIYLNEIYVLGNGIPPEIIQVIDTKRIIMDITIQHRIIIESLGVILHKDKLITEQFNF